MRSFQIEELLDVELIPGVKVNLFGLKIEAEVSERGLIGLLVHGEQHISYGFTGPWSEERRTPYTATHWMAKALWEAVERTCSVRIRDLAEDCAREASGGRDPRHSDRLSRQQMGL